MEISHFHNLHLRVLLYLKEYDINEIFCYCIGFQ